MRIPELDRCVVRGDDTPHLAVTILGGRGTRTFCDKRVEALYPDARYADLCMSCVHRAKRMGCEE